MAAARPRKPRLEKLLANSAADNRALQLNLPGICRSDKTAVPPRRSEKVLQSQARQALAGLGYSSLEAGTGRPHITCPCGCGHSFVPTGWMGNTVGYPDLAFFRMSPAFPAVGILVELKGDGTKIRPQQQQLADEGRSVIAHSIDDTVRAVFAAEEAMDAYRFAPARRELFARFFERNAHWPS